MCRFWLACCDAFLDLTRVSFARWQVRSKTQSECYAIQVQGPSCSIRYVLEDNTASFQVANILSKHKNILVFEYYSVFLSSPSCSITAFKMNQERKAKSLLHKEFCSPRSITPASVVKAVVLGVVFSLEVSNQIYLMLLAR